jgi:uncharacterized protein
MWIEIIHTPTARAPHVLLELDKGEKATLLAAQESNADLILMDEKIGRNVAEYLGLTVMGTLGILLRAHKQKQIPSFRQAANQMQLQGIYFNVALINRLAASVGERD